VAKLLLPGKARISLDAAHIVRAYYAGPVTVSSLSGGNAAVLDKRQGYPLTARLNCVSGRCWHGVLRVGMWGNRADGILGLAVDTNGNVLASYDDFDDYAYYFYYIRPDTMTDLVADTAPEYDYMLCNRKTRNCEHIREHVGAELLRDVYAMPRVVGFVNDGGQTVPVWYAPIEYREENLGQLYHEGYMVVSSTLSSGQRGCYLRIAGPISPSYLLRILRGEMPPDYGSGQSAAPGQKKTMMPSASCTQRYAMLREMPDDSNGTKWVIQELVFDQSFRTASARVLAEVGPWVVSLSYSPDCSRLYVFGAADDRRPMLAVIDTTTGEVGTPAPRVCSRYLDVLRSKELSMLGVSSTGSDLWFTAYTAKQTNVYEAIACGVDSDKLLSVDTSRCAQTAQT